MKYKHWKRWILVNTLFATLLGIGWFTTYSWAVYPRNIIIFVTWLMLALGLVFVAITIVLVVATPKLKPESQKSLALDIAKIDAAPQKLDRAYDACVVLALAAAGSFVLAGVYLISQVALNIGRHILKGLVESIATTTPEVQKAIEELEPVKKINCVELDI